MSKQNTVRASILSASVLAILFLISAVITAQTRGPAARTRSPSMAALGRSNLAFAAQKGPQSAASSVRPVKGIDVIVQKDPGNTASRTTVSDAEGSFTVADLAPGLYEVRLECKKCQRMDIGQSGVRFRLTGTKENDFKRKVSKEQLVEGVKFRFEIVGQGRKGGQIKGSLNIDGAGSN